MLVSARISTVHKIRTNKSGPIGFCSGKIEGLDGLKNWSYMIEAWLIVWVTSVNKKLDRRIFDYIEGAGQISIRSIVRSLSKASFVFFTFFLVD